MKPVLKKAFAWLLLFCMMLCSSCGTPPQAPLSLSLSASSLQLTVGDSAPLYANTTGKQSDVMWRTTDSTVAIFSNGMVIAKAEGACLITATIGTYTASCSVTVERDLLRAEEISFPADVVYLGVGETREDVITTLPDTLEDYSGTIESSNPAVASATYSADSKKKIRISGESPGTATITLTMKNGVSDTIQVVVVDFSKLIKFSTPTLPKTISYSILSDVVSRGTITSVAVQEAAFYDKNTVLVKLSIIGKKTYDYSEYDAGFGCGFTVKSYKENHILVETRNVVTQRISVGSSFAQDYIIKVYVDDNLTPRTITLEFYDYNF